MISLSWDFVHQVIVLDVLMKNTLFLFVILFFAFFDMENLPTSRRLNLVMRAMVGLVSMKPKVTRVASTSASFTSDMLIFFIDDIEDWQYYIASIRGTFMTLADIYGPIYKGLSYSQLSIQIGVIIYQIQVHDVVEINFESP